MLLTDSFEVKTQTLRQLSWKSHPLCSEHWLLSSGQFYSMTFLLFLLHTVTNLIQICSPSQNTHAACEKSNIYGVLLMEMQLRYRLYDWRYSHKILKGLIVMWTQVLHCWVKCKPKNLSLMFVIFINSL